MSPISRGSAELVVYRRAPGTVVRCRTCGSVLMVFVKAHDVTCVDLAGWPAWAKTRPAFGEQPGIADSPGCRTSTQETTRKERTCRTKSPCPWARRTTDPIPLRSLPTHLPRPGDLFPELTLTVPGGKTVTVPTMFVGQFGVVLFTRAIRTRSRASAAAPTTSNPASRSRCTMPSRTKCWSSPTISRICGGGLTPPKLAQPAVITSPGLARGRAGRSLAPN
jgi:hypothetical protein